MLTASQTLCLSLFPSAGSQRPPSGFKGNHSLPIYPSTLQHCSPSTMPPFCTTVNALSFPDTIPVPHSITLLQQGGEPSSFSLSPSPMFSSLPSFPALSLLF